LIRYDSVLRFVALVVVLSGCDILFQVQHVELKADAPAAPRPDSSLPSWKPPQPLSAVNAAAPTYDSDASLTGDGLDLYFASDRGKAALEFDIYQAHRNSTTESFGAPVLVTELSTSFNESGSISPDGLRFYMTRTGVSGVLVAKRPSTSVGWGAPVMDAQLSVLVNPANPSMSGDELSFVVNAPSGSTMTDLYLYSRATKTEAWEVPRKVTEIDSPDTDAAASFTSNGLSMFFHTNREAGVLKVYETSRPALDQSFVFANTYPVSEALPNGNDPFISPDGRTLVFTRDGDLYITTR
jgi:Tol biopolymer transport system component